MKPLDADLDLGALVQRALANCADFDHATHRAWLQTQSGTIQQVARERPPDRLYRVHGWGAGAVVLVFVEGYMDAHEGVPAHCVVRVLGTASKLGAPAGALEDVTETLRAGKLPNPHPFT